MNVEKSLCPDPCWELEVLENTHWIKRLLCNNEDLSSDPLDPCNTLAWL